MTALRRFTLEETAELAALYQRERSSRRMALALGVCPKTAMTWLHRAGIAPMQGGRRAGARLSLAVDLLAIYRDAGVPLSLATAARWCERPAAQVALVLRRRYGTGKPRGRRARA